MRILFFHIKLKGSCDSCDSSELVWEGCQILGIDEKIGLKHVFFIQVEKRARISLTLQLHHMKS